MWRYVVGMTVMSLVTFKGVEKYAEYRGYTMAENGQQVSDESDRLASLTNDQSHDNSTSYAGRNAKIRMDERGHFVTTAKMNGRRVEVLVDVFLEFRRSRKENLVVLVG